MNIEESIEYLKLKIKNDNLTIQGMFGDIYEEIRKDNTAIETLLTAYEKEKEKNKELNKSDESKEESSMYYYNLYKNLMNKIKNMLQELKERENKQPVIGYWSKKAMLEKLLKEEKDDTSI